jgi:MFS family permease
LQKQEKISFWENPPTMMNQHFKRPLKLTGWIVLAGLVLGIIGSTWIYLSDISDRKKVQRVTLLGSGLGTMSALVAAPFWLVAAGKIGKERRAAQGKSW